MARCMVRGMHPWVLMAEYGDANGFSSESSGHPENKKIVDAVDLLHVSYQIWLFANHFA